MADRAYFEWFKLVVDEWEEWTEGLELDEEGALIRLICVQWKRGSIPDDEKQLRRLLRGPRAFDRIWKALEPLFPRIAGLPGARGNVRIAERLAATRAKSDGAQMAAVKSWKTRRPADASAPANAGATARADADANADADQEIEDQVHVRDPRAGAGDAGADPPTVPATPPAPPPPPAFDDEPPPFDEPAPWWAIDRKRLLGWWEAETAAYAPDATLLDMLRAKIEAALRGPGVVRDADEVEGFARTCCRATRRLASAWTKSWKPIGCTPGLGASNFDLVQRTARGELSDEDLERTGREKAARGGGGRGGGGGGEDGGGLRRGAVPVRSRST